MRDLFNQDMDEIVINKPIRLIELFGGYGSQFMAMKRIGAKVESWLLCEFDPYAVKSFNAIHGTNYKPSDVCELHGKDLKIVEKDKYCYMLTYSFPCTDLSVAGKMQGMSKADWENGKSTRSGLLWEVERILSELPKEDLPQVLFMENVPQVHGTKNVNDFNLWIDFLKSKGYSNFWQDLNAKDYGVAQNRKRCFMVSILGNEFYEFPQPVKLNKCIKDYLEDEVDEKYYIKSEKAFKLIVDLQERGILESAPSTACLMNLNKVEKVDNDVANTLMARDYKGFGNQAMNGVIECQKSKSNEIIVIGKMDHTLDNTLESANRIYSKDGICPTIPTCAGGNIQPKILETKDVKQNFVSDGNGGITTGCSPEIKADETIKTIEAVYRIRRLTPTECGRLMGVDDCDIEKMKKANSNSQLYKQFGNSIVVDVMCAMFRQLNIAGVPKWNKE